MLKSFWSKLILLLVFITLGLVLFSKYSQVKKIGPSDNLYKITESKVVLPEVSFTFTASGDFAANKNTAKVLALINPSKSGAAFHLALGDFKYDQLKTENEWCSFVKSHVGESFPFELISGNHEDDGPDGTLENFVKCLPDRLGMSGDYGKEYFFDYPNDAPLARFILISPDLNFGSGYYKYISGSTHYAFLSEKIDEARGKKIPWVIVGMHKPCLTMGVKSCEVGADLYNLLISKKVDLVLMGHEHNYQRSKALGFGVGCSAIVPDSFESGCVVDDGLDGSYTRGNGTVFIISGTGGASLYLVDSKDAEEGYFANWTKDSTNGYGFTKFKVSGDEISGEFMDSLGNVVDDFAIK